MTRAPSPYCESAPSVQRAWDSTSLTTFMECPRKYQYAILGGWQPKVTPAPLVFGILFHKGIEVLAHAKAKGKSHEVAVDEMVAHLLEISGKREGKGKRQKWIPWFSEDSRRSIITLIRAVVWYAEHFKGDAAKTIKLPNGEAAVELSFRIPLTFMSPDGTPYLLCGHIDELGKFGASPYVKERKHTVQGLSARYFAQFSPNFQVSTYTFGSKVVWKLPTKGVIIDAAQVGVTFARFARQFATRTKRQLEEWYDGLEYWIKQAEACGLAKKWPMNETSCGNYGGCEYRGVCSKDASVRAAILRATFVQTDPWNPLESREA